MELPILRYIDVIPVEHEGEQLICIRDPQGYATRELVLYPHIFFIAAHLQTPNTISGIQQAFSAQFEGHELPADVVQQTVDLLDEHGYLQTDRFDRLREAVEAEFAASPVRPMSLAGGVYPADPTELLEYIDAMFTRPGGPGVLPPQRSDLPWKSPDTRAKGLITPHIDYDRGGHSYAHGWLSLSRFRKPKRAIVLGVAHVSPPAPFVLTRKNFETPLGTLRCDTDAVNRLADAASWDAFMFEFVHRDEHSIELQAVMLAYLYGTEIEIIPILCSSFLCMEDGISPSEEEATEDFLRVLAELVDDDTVVIAGADLAHVGKRFGDPFDIDDAIVSKVRERDMEALRAAVDGDAEGFYASVMKDDNERNVCGLTCIYSAIRAIGETSGELLHYDYAHDPAGGIVSFANVILK
jgi:AmmeMemoRadiSam system protein B